jgi:hypothetical protein
MTNGMRTPGFEKVIAACLAVLLGTAAGCGSQESSSAGRRADERGVTERSEALAEVTRLRAIVAQRPDDRASLVNLAISGPPATTTTRSAPSRGRLPCLATVTRS